ncbi:MAG: zinc ribbon domain-containing protein [Chloroflexi bacterium]|jgi:RNA polymerase subunit RPABC4/transcription elongation factor Spt4|nr:zinc ribbon domain-containing protein [Chloroflexota bacterium]
MNLDPQQISNLSMIGIALIAAFFAALWLGLLFWVIRDIRLRSRDPFLMILSALLVIILPMVGVIIYLIIRPGKTIEDRYQAALEEEALLQEIEKQPKCPGCGRSVDAKWILCPACHTRLNKLCISCGEVIEIPWNLCPYCGVPQQKVYKEQND